MQWPDLRQLCRALANLYFCECETEQYDRKSRPGTPKIKPQANTLTMLSTNDQMGSGSVLCTRVAAVAGGLGNGAPACGGGAPNGANSANCESGCQVPIPSRHPISLRAKRPLRKPSRTSFSAKMPRLVVPRLRWNMTLAC